jgi:MFS family permease
MNQTDSTGPEKLWNKNFFIQWQGQMISRLGTQAFIIGQLFFIKQETGSATLLGLLAMLSSLPGLIMGPIGGVLADRFSRKLIIILSDFVRGISLLVLCAALLFMEDNTNYVLFVIFLVSILNSIITPVFSSSIQSTIPDLVPQEKVTSANSIAQLSVQLTVFLGQMMGGTLYRIFGPLTLFFVDALSFFYSSTSELFVDIPPVKSKKTIQWKGIFNSFWQDLVEGWKYVVNRPGLKEAILASAMLAFFSTPVIILLPFYVEDFLKVKIDWYGYLLAFTGLGAIFGYILAGTLRLKGMGKSKTLIGFMFVNSIGYGLLGFIRNPYLAVLVAFIAGVATGFITVHITSIIQQSTPTEIRGRVLGLLGAISGSLTPLAMGLSGVIADLLNQNLTLIYVGCGIIMTLLVLVFAFRKDFRVFLGFTPEFNKQAGVE